VLQLYRICRLLTCWSLGDQKAIYLQPSRGVTFYRNTNSLLSFFPLSTLLYWKKVTEYWTERKEVEERTNDIESQCAWEMQGFSRACWWSVSPGAPTNASLTQFLLTINGKIRVVVNKKFWTHFVTSIIQSTLILAPLSSYKSTALILTAFDFGESYDAFIWWWMWKMGYEKFVRKFMIGTMCLQKFENCDNPFSTEHLWLWEEKPHNLLNIS